MTMTASNTAGTGRNLCDCPPKLEWHFCNLAAPAIEHRANRAPEFRVLTPKLHPKAASPAIEEDGILQSRPSTWLRTCQAVPGDEQVICPLNPDHLQSHENGSDHGGMHAVDPDAVHALEPGQRITVLGHEARISAQICYGTARVDASEN